MDSMRPAAHFVGAIGNGGRNADVGRALADEDPGNIDYSAGFTFSLPVQNRASRGAEEVAAGHRRQRRARRPATRAADPTGGPHGGAGPRRGRARDYGRVAVAAAQDDLEAEKARFSVARSTTTTSS